ncbi:MAG: ATP-binding protein [Thermoplasmatota archaeon]
MEEKETLAIIPDTSIFPKMAKTGYSTAQSIAELVDNAIDAKVEGERLSVSIEADSGKLVVCDDGMGMTKTGLHDAVVLGKSSKKNQLGEYGLGLKAAALSIGGRFSVLTATASSQNAFKVTFDEDDWAAKQKWEIDVYTQAKNRGFTRGTIVEITKLKLRPDRHLPQLRIELGQRFGPFISAGEFVLTVNGKPCVYRMPEIDKSTRKDFRLATSHGEVFGWYALLKRGSQRGRYGFATYRRGRLITTYDHIGFTPHPTLARLIGEVHMDFVQVTTNKREWLKETAEYQEVEQLLAEELKPILRLARQKASDEGVNKLVRERLEIFKEGLFEALRSPEISAFDKPEAYVGSIPTKNSKFAGLIEERESSSKVSVPKKVPEKEIDRYPKRIQNPRKNIVKVKGMRFEFEHSYFPLGEDAKSYEYEVNEKSRIVEIFTNTLFPAFNTTHDQAFYGFTHIVDSLANLFLVYGKEPMERFDDIRDLILRKSTEYVEELKEGKKREYAE